MTEEKIRQKAEAALDKRLGTYGYINKDRCCLIYIDGYIDGATENGIVWHKVADGDIPPDRHNVLSEKGEVVVMKDMRWYEYSPNYDNILQRSWEEPKYWCDIPTRGLNEQAKKDDA